MIRSMTGFGRCETVINGREITRKNFDKINALREEEGLDPFMNPRNTASGSLKMQNCGEVRKRGLSAVLYQYIAENFPAEPQEVTDFLTTNLKTM